MAAVKGYYMSKKEICNCFHVGQSVYTNIRRIIREHPERYSYYAVIDNLTSSQAFADAKVFRKQLEKGEQIPAFDPDAAAALLGVLSNER